jgi:hypothetical protein
MLPCSSPTLLSLWLVLGLRFWAALLIVLGILLLPLPLGRVIRGAHRGSYLAVVATWLLCALYAVVTGRSETLPVTFVLPIVVPFAALWIARTAQLAVRIPLFVPAALAVVVAPLLTEDPWAFVAQSRWRLAFLAAIVLIPLLLLVVRRLRRVELAPIDRAAGIIAADEKAAAALGAKMLNGRIM